MGTHDYIVFEMEKFFPNAHCELIHDSAFQLAIAVVLSAQTTDAAVNKVVPTLFDAYPTCFDLSKASIKDVENIICKLGLYKNKARLIVGLAQTLVDDFNGVMPTSMKQLTSLPGVGRKSANVIRSVCFDIPSFAVDTHVTRVSKRLKLAKPNDSVEVIEAKLKRKISKELWNTAHHTFIFWGRYKCKAISPDCFNCPFSQFCTYMKNKK